MQRPDSLLSTFGAFWLAFWLSAFSTTFPLDEISTVNTSPSDSPPPASGHQPQSAAPASAAPASAGSERWSLRRFLRLGAQILLLVGVFVIAGRWQTRQHLPRKASPAPDFTLTDLQGNRVRLSDFRGKTVLLHFWATWCGVCRHEVGALNAVAESLDENEVLLTVVADGDERDAISHFVNERGVRYPVLLGNEAVLEAYRVTMFPTNYFLDREGRIATSTVGMSSRWSLQARMGCSR